MSLSARWSCLVSIVLLAFVACTKSAPPAPGGAVTPGPSSPVTPAPAEPAPVPAEPAPSPEPTAALVDCTPSKILCRRRAPDCPAGEVPSVEGSCFGPCVPVTRCACTEATQCPQPEQHTCWKKEHCGPFVR